MTGVLKVDDIQDAGANSIVSSNGSGTLTLGSFTAPNITASTAILPDASDGAAIGSASLEWSDIFLADGAVINLGDDQDVTLTHVADTGILLNSSRKIQFGDSATFIHQSSDGVMTVDGEATIDLNASTAVLVSNDLKLDSDAAVLSFGADSEITLTHSADVGLILKHTATADDKPINFILQTGETDIAQDDVLGKISWQAPDEGTGTDAILTAAAIQAVSEGDFSSSSNATSLQFMTGASEAAAEKMTLTSAGILNTTKLGVITDHDLGAGIHVRTADSSADVYAGADELVLENNGEAGITILSATNSYGNIFFGDSGLNRQGKIYYSHGDDSLNFFANNTNLLYMSDSISVFNEDSNNIDFRVESNGNTAMLYVDGGSDFVSMGKNNGTASNAGNYFSPTSENHMTIADAPVLILNRQSDDGHILYFKQANSAEGSVSVSGSTVSYNTFCGSHWSRLADNSKPTILRGTVMESIATMCDWYQAVATDSDGNKIIEDIALPNGKSIGEAVHVKI